MRKESRRSCRLALLLLAAGPLYGSLIITPYFESSITSDSNAAAIESAISNAIDFYDTTIASNLDITIAFGEMSSGLGQSTSYISTISYNSYITALNSHSSGDTTDTTALAHLPTGSNNPVNNGANITAKLANEEALGITGTQSLSDPCGGGPSANYGGCIQLNTSITTPPNAPGGGEYSLVAVAEHEIDEVLGLGSGVGGTPQPEDLFRYDSLGNRSFVANSGDTSTTCSSSSTAYFSLNAATDLAQFNNCANGGDYGDWAAGASPKVQDAYGTPGSSPVLSAGSPEVVALDAIGYNLNAASATPEPASLLLVAPLLAGILIGRRRRRSGDKVA